ncbi:MAG: DUF4185 domain-containing protein [bacterium]
MKHKRIYALLLSSLAIGMMLGCNKSPTDSSTATTDARSVVSWPAADALFRSDPSWLGGDGAYSIDLGSGRVLWLFGDSFIATSDKHVRSESKMVRNSVAIQFGYDPSAASIAFYWTVESEEPQSFFPEKGNLWFWPGHGIRLENTLLIFLMKTRSANRDLGFETVGWTAVSISNPDDAPDNWQLSWLDAPANDYGVAVGSASVLRIDDYLYAFSAEEPGVHDVYIVRWPVERARQGDLSEPQWWTGEVAGWVAQHRLTRKPQVAFAGGQTEFTVHYEPALGKFLEIQTDGFGSADLAMRTADALTGPWSGLARFHRPDEYGISNILIYAGKSHPELVGADNVLTYVANNLDFNKLVNDTTIYYPRFLKGTVIERRVR